MEILLWLVPAAVVTVAAMLWVAWWGRESRGEVDRETAARRMGEALTRERKLPGYAAPRRAPETSTGVAVRRRPDGPSASPDRRGQQAAGATPPAALPAESDRRAS